MPTRASVPPDALFSYHVDALPRPFTGPGTLHLRFPQLRPLGKALAVLLDSPWTFTRDRNLVSIRVAQHELIRLLETVAARLTHAEQGEVRVLFEPDGTAQLADYFESGSLLRFLARRLTGWLLEMIRQNRLFSVFQPIVCAADGRLFGHECLVRGLDQGELIAAGRILQVAGGAGLLFQTDQAARCSAIRGAARYKLPGKIFINFSPTAFDDPVHGLTHTVALLDELGIERRQVVFEVIESERIVDLDYLEKMLGHYRTLDFEVALDDVGSGYSSLNVLQRLRPDYVKLDAQLIRNVDADPYKAVLTSKLLEASAQLGVRTVAEGVESEGEHRWLRAHGANYLQGYHFARPASPPPAVHCAA
jgi:EAL domain-containing protein (putative c-di-GMP-specific phosphodiesterase class I)